MVLKCFWFKYLNKTCKLGIAKYFSLPHCSIVSECGASIYSVSKLAEQEMPELDPSLRGAGTFMLLVISNNLLSIVHKSKGN